MRTNSRNTVTIVMSLLLFSTGLIFVAISQVTVKSENVKELNRVQKAWNVTAYFKEGDQIFGFILPPPYQQPGWQDSAEPPCQELPYGYIPYYHIFVYLDLYDSEGRLISEIEIVYVISGFENLVVYNFSKVIITNETGPYPRISIERINGWFEMTTANATQEYTLTVWGLYIGPGTNKPPPSVLALGKKVEEIHKPYEMLLFLGLMLGIIGATTTFWSFKARQTHLKRKYARRRLKYASSYRVL